MTDRLCGAAVTAALLTALAGCSPSQPKAAPVDPEKARTTLRAVLDAWKAGGARPVDMKDRTPSVVVQEWDWETGNRLTEYKILGDETADANLRVRVALSLRDKSGKDVQKTVTYVVGTDPVLTVFRELPL